MVGMVVMMELRQKADPNSWHCNCDGNGVVDISSSYTEQHYFVDTYRDGSCLNASILHSTPFLYRVEYPLFKCLHSFTTKNGERQRTGSCRIAVRAVEQPQQRFLIFSINDRREYRCLIVIYYLSSIRNITKTTINRYHESAPSDRV